MSDRTKGLTFALLSAILYGFIPILGKKFVTIFSPLFVALLVVVIADFYLAAIALWRKELFKNLFKKDIKWVVLIGFLAALGSILSFVGLSVGKANEAGFFFQFETFFAAILAFFFLKEKLSFRQVAGLIVMFLGAYIFSSAFQASFRLGNLLFLGAAFVWGLNDVIIRKTSKQFSSFFLSFGRNFFSALFLLPLAYKYIPQNIEKINSVQLIYFFLYGAVVAGIILSLYHAFRYIKTAEATSFQLLSPIITLTVAFLVFQETLSKLGLLGGGLILVGLYLITQFKKSVTIPRSIKFT